MRTAVGLTQAKMAAQLGVSRKAVGEWEAGLTYPKAERLKALIVLAVGRQAFLAGREEEEIRAFWQAASQKMLLDEAWLAALLTHREVSPTSQLTRETSSVVQDLAPTTDRPRVDWGDALTVTTFCGREWELILLTEWIVRERCRVSASRCLLPRRSTLYLSASKDA